MVSPPALYHSVCCALALNLGLRIGELKTSYDRKKPGAHESFDRNGKQALLGMFKSQEINLLKIIGGDVQVSGNGLHGCVDIGIGKSGRVWQKACTVRFGPADHKDAQPLHREIP